MPHDKLYVVFHGLISLVEDRSNNRFRALLIEMPDHRFAAGHWLTEQTIPRGASFHLDGVQGGQASLDGTKNLVIKDATLNRAALQQYLYADISLPKPLSISSYSVTDVGPMLTGDRSRLTSTNFSVTQVFEYNVTGQNAFLIGDVASAFNLRLLSGTQLPSGDTITTLHVVNEPEMDPPDGHNLEEFKRSMLVLGSDLLLTGNVLLKRDLATPPPAGLLRGELLPLTQRVSNVFDMLGGLRRNQPLMLADAIGTNMVCGGGNGIIG